MDFRGRHDPVVYFARSLTTGLIKIGYTSNMRTRMAAVRYTERDRIEVLGFVAGDQGREYQIHREFRHSRRKGEWFEAVPDLLEFIDHFATPYVNPCANKSPAPKKTTASYLLPTDLVVEMKVTAARLGVTVSKLAEILLTEGLERHYPDTRQPVSAN